MKLRSVIIYLFIFSFCGWTFYQQFFTSRYSFVIENEDLYIKIFNYVFFFLFFTCFLFLYRFNNYSIIDLFLIITFTGVLFVTKQFGFLVNFLIVLLVVRYFKFSFILKSFFITTMFLLIIVYIGYLFGLFDENVSIDAFREDGKERYLLGFKFFTFLPSYFFHLFLVYLILRKEKINFKEITLFFILNYILFYFTDTRAIYYLVNLIFVFIIIQKITRIDYKTKFGIGYTISLTTKYSYIIFFCIAVYLQCNYDSNISWMNELNQALSGRLELGHKGYSLYGVKLFGSNVEYVGFLDITEGESYFYIDSAYQQLLINYGVLISLLLGIGFLKAISVFINQNDIYTGTAIVFLLIHSMTDPQLIFTAYNPLIYMVAYYGHKQNLLR